MSRNTITVLLHSRHKLLGLIFFLCWLLNGLYSVDARMINEYGAEGGMITVRRNLSI
jgi:hypothetical protein